MLIELNEENFYETIAKGLKLVEFYTTWCGFCAKQQSVLNEMKEINIYQANADDLPLQVKQYNINAFPTFVIFKEGKEMKKLYGYQTKFELMNNLVPYL